MKPISIPTTTLAAVLVKIGKPLQLMELEIPELKPGQVLVKIIYSGICRSQLNEIDGIKGQDPYLPHTLGHEGSGFILTTGEGVGKVRPGEPVVISWIKGSGADIPSTVYNSMLGPVNSGAISTFMQYAVVSENRVTPIDPQMPLKEAALLGCAIPTGAGVIFNTCKVKPRESVAIFGCGGIGLSALLAAKYVDASPIIAIDIDNKKLQQSREYGATFTINSIKEDVLRQIYTFTDGIGVNYAIEASGINSVMETAFKCVKNNGGLCVLVGNVRADSNIKIDPYDLINGKVLLGTWGGETNPDRDIPMYVDNILKKRFIIPESIYKQYSLKDINNGINDFRDGLVIRPIIMMSSF
jgi:S-(hydroxymethyl)glutathione dehydrogenase/alcohol dehydrogenase